MSLWKSFGIRLEILYKSCQLMQPLPKEVNVFFTYQDTRNG